MFRPNSPQLSEVTPIGGIIMKALKYTWGETRDTLMGNNHVWSPWLGSGYKNKKITFSCSTINKNVNTFIDKHCRQLMSNDYFSKQPAEKFCKKRCS